ncbi:BN860_03378g1_1 [Zygosaccharomyces bailii CLIB 213]|uniref:BN860_03378g1_1 n=1 Tax=Zygosaccharomyces bailii (strain CLIB 213 / ATCC 58445 / CBS 680 / BCRC 21525 / NBRC 1098 / NCYC 1416 / NRRL Y-2227) TaxID=1333698 RepID=A0A8J2X611_ZYGB2|nr:BN860_03378g1_1 [Zygosaccharomyces bailii CLIB 213]
MDSMTRALFEQHSSLPTRRQPNSSGSQGSMVEQHSLVWVPDGEKVFVQGDLIEEKVVTDKGNKEKPLSVVRVQGHEKEFAQSEVCPVNPSTFDKVDDMSELTHLNEPSVLYNLENRYHDDLIYTYSGLFLVAINPYCNVRIYTQEYVNLYHGSPKEDNKPHIFAVAEEAYQKLLCDKQDQSVLVTGESGAGKTENTKRILQYLASITSEDKLLSTKQESFERKILESNPILESFGNAQTVRNNNSSRFGKFIKIEFDERGKINGAHIEWYLLEKSRIAYQNPLERNYHIFYQLLQGLSSQELRKLELNSTSIKDYRYLCNSNASIPGVDDAQDFQELLSAFKIMGFADDEVNQIFQVISIILHLGNVEFVSEKAEQASIKGDISALCRLLGTAENDFKAAILKPKSKAGREWVAQAKNAQQSRFILNSLSRTLYEKLFSFIVDKINRSLDHGSMTANYIGLLDIAGFEIFQHNSFEQLCINYTNEKLQQFFNHYMFVLEQNEYLKENIQWDYIDYGKDLQSTINLIEQKGPPTGLLSLLDEESILPKSTDDSFFSKLISTWDQKSNKFKRAKKPSCFILKHYAGDVEYNTNGWLSKNKDPLNDHLLRLLAESPNELIKGFFSESPKVRGGSFRTASSRHREQLSSLLDQLSSTNPHFARCIIPNNKKKAKDFDKRLILDQLRCNGVLEGIRIAREGYPNRIFFKEFYQRYQILADDTKVSHGAKKNSEFLLSSLHLDPSLYKVGATKLFFKAGVLAELELKKEEKIFETAIKLNAYVRGGQIRHQTNQQLQKLRAARVLGETFRAHNKMMEDPWYNLYLRIKPLLSSSQDIAKSKKVAKQVKELEAKLKTAEGERDKALENESSAARDLDELRRLLATEVEKLKDHQELLATAKENQSSLQQRLEDANKLREQIEQERIKKEEQHEKALQELTQIKQTSNDGEEQLKDLEDKNAELKKQVERLQAQIAEKESALRSLEQSKSKISKELVTIKSKESTAEEELAKLKSQQLTTKREMETLRSAESARKREFEKLKMNETSKEKEIATLKSKLNSSEQDVNIKLNNLEKNCEAAMKRLKTLVTENTDLNSKIEILEKEKNSYTRELSSKERELNRMKEKTDQHQEEMSVLASQRDNVVGEHNQVVEELKETRAQLMDYKMKLQHLEKEYDTLSAQSSEDKKVNGSLRYDDSKVKELERRIAQETSLNHYLTQKLSSRPNSPRPLSEMGPMGEEELRNFEEINIQLEESKRNLEAQIEEKKDLISRLRFTETRLASSSFDSQLAHTQVKKLKEIIKNSNLSIDLDKELQDLKPSDINLEKLVLEIDHLKRQLDIETKARYDAENVVSALHNKFSQIQRSDSSSDIYRLKYEASEERAKSLENKLRHTPLKDRTNLAGSIFTNRENFSKYADEVRFHKLENYKLQEVLADSNKKISKLSHEIKQSSAKEVMLSEQIERLEKDLHSTEGQNQMLASTIRQQKAQFENCVNDLHETESKSREYINALKQAEEDVQSMVAVIDKMKTHIKQKDKVIWQRETEKNELEMQLQETALELKRAQDINAMLDADLTHLKERLAKREENSQSTALIDGLKEELDTLMKSETGMKKEISTYKYQLETLANDSQAKIGELLKQVQHYETLVATLSDERDMADAAEKDLTKKLEIMMLRADGLAETVESVTKEKNQLDTEIENIKNELLKSNSNFEKTLQENHDIANNVSYLKETLQLQQDQNARNEALVKQLQEEVDLLKASGKEEKQRFIELNEEYQALERLNSQAKTKVNFLESQLADTSEKDAWLSKMHQLESLVTKETQEKYEEMKKVKNLELVVESLKEKNDNQAEIISIANDDKEQFDVRVLQYNEQIAVMEKHLSKQDMDLRKCVRDNANFQNKVEGLEREISFWKERYDTLASGRSNAKAAHSEEVFI